MQLLRRYRHWNRTYAINRISSIVYEKKNPDAPWLTKTANLCLDSLLRKTDIGLEFGSGRSTIWLAKRIASLTSIEHDTAWFHKVNHMLKEEGCTNCELLFFKQDQPKELGQGTEYVSVPNMFDRYSLDFALIDGIYRSACSNAVLDRIKPGGILVLDDAQWYLPSKSITQNARSLEEGPATEDWETFLERIAKWRCIWTSDNCLHDTAIFIRNA